MRVLVLVFAVILAPALFFLLRSRTESEVRVAMAEFQTGGGGAARSGVTASGYVVARTKASISSKISGRLEYLGVTEGQGVASGDVLARLENADYQAELKAQQAMVALARAALLEATAERDQLRRDVSRLEDLKRDQLISDQEAERLASSLAAAEARVLSREAQIRSAEAQVEVARANIENTIIRAPFDGTVLRRDAEVGELVAPSMSAGALTRGAVVTLADLRTLEVEVDVNESYIGRVRTSTTARVVLDAYPDVSFRGEIRQVMPTADRQRATVQVKVSILDSDPRILPEMGARVEFMEVVTGETEAAKARIFVPAEAVHEEDGAVYVFVVREGRVEKRTVDAGSQTGGKREVYSGLGGGEQVVIEGPERLSAGMRVKVAA